MGVSEASCFWKECPHLLKEQYFGSLKFSVLLYVNNFSNKSKKMDSK